MYDLSPFDFDQSDAGWRSFDATAIEAYISRRADIIRAQDEVSIHFKNDSVLSKDKKVGFQKRL